MSKNLKRKKILSSICIALCILLMVGFMPAKVHAASTSVPGAEGHVLTDIVTGTFEDGYDSTVFVYTTPNVSDNMQYVINDNIAVFAVPDYNSSDWYFAGWKTWYKGSHSGAGIITSDKANPKYDDNDNYFTVSSNGEVIQGRIFPAGSMVVLKESLWKGTYYLSAIFEPIVTINVDEGISYTIPAATKRAESKYSTKYNNSLAINYSVDNGYVITGVSATYGTTYSDNGSSVSLTNIIRPATVTIKAKLKQQKLIFDTNGGSGAMATQVFEYGKEQVLSENTFTKIGYRFTGWNTMPDGSDTAYTDKQSVTFTPANDGDKITLYAQWTECTSHTWDDGVCSDCGKVCSHNYVYSGSDNVITETCTAGCSHNETATIKQDDSIPTVYNGSSIEALKVVYSHGWEGGTLDISYTDNIKAGTAQGTITKDNATATGIFEITKAQASDITTPTVNEVTYGKKLSDIPLKDRWSWADGNVIPTVINSGYTAFYTPTDTDNYDWSAIEGWNNTLKKVVRTVPITVTPKELTITWGNTTFTYDGTEKFPETIVGGIITGDDIQLIRSGAETNANAEGESYTATITGIAGADAANYKLPDDVSTEFTISKAPQPAPDNTDNTVNTGDNNIIWLWLILIFISSGIAITIVSFNRRR